MRMIDGEREVDLIRQPFFEIEVQQHDGPSVLVSIRRREVQSVQLRGNSIALILNGAEQPMVFTMGTIDAAVFLYRQIQKELNV